MSWIGGLAEWQEDNTLYLSVAFTWRLDDAHARARFARAQGLRVIAGGPALFLVQMKHKLADVAEMGAEYPDAIAHHNFVIDEHSKRVPLATVASRGCPQDCWFCIVPKMEGKAFTLIPEFPVRPVLCDNNLSALPPDYQDYIIRRYREAGVKLSDANSGFEPVTFTPDVYERWKPLINEGGGPWRFAYDELKERTEALRVMRMLVDEPRKRKRVYVLIGNEPFDDCMRRIQEVIENDCEPHCQPLLKLNAPRRDQYWIRFDWTEERLRNVARWANRWMWKKMPRFMDYNNHYKRDRVKPERYDSRQGLFL